MNHVEASNAFSPATEDGIDDVLLHDQQFFVFQLAHAETSIRSEDGNAWIRCIGFVKTLDAARTLARNAFNMGDKMETRIMPAGRVFLAGRLKYEGLDLPRREEEQVKANHLVDDWIKMRESIHKEVQQIASSKTVLPDPFEHKSSDTSAVKVSTPAPGWDELPKASPHTVIVERQGAWACAIIPDSSHENEPAVIPLFAANDIEDTQTLVRRAARCKDLVHMDIFVGKTAEWQPLVNPTAAQTFHHHPLRQATESTIRWVKS